jgi:hypothetical protein
MSNTPTIKKNSHVIIWILFAILSLWWIKISLIDKNIETYQNLLWAASYQAVAIFGGFWGLFIARSWGGLKSVMGRSITFFALGLLLQAFGQTVFSYYNLFLGIEIPYPSLADVGFFGSIPCYMYAIYQLGKASGITISLQSFKSKLQVLVIPIIMVYLSYHFFLESYEFDVTNATKIFLDFGYPIGQAIYISIAILTFTLSKKILGGIMKNKVLFILIALAIQYYADNNFLFQTTSGTWINGGYGDYIYLVAYFLMGLGLMKLDTVFRRKTEPQNTDTNK